jgi:hypothetical protein
MSIGREYRFRADGPDSSTGNSEDTPGAGEPADVRGRGAPRMSSGPYLAHQSRAVPPTGRVAPGLGMAITYQPDAARQAGFRQASDRGPVSLSRDTAGPGSVAVPSDGRPPACRSGDALRADVRRFRAEAHTVTGGGQLHGPFFRTGRRPKARGRQG